MVRQLTERRFRRRLWPARCRCFQLHRESTSFDWRALYVEHFFLSRIKRTRDYDERREIQQAAAAGAQSVSTPSAERTDLQVVSPFRQFSVFFPNMGRVLATPKASCCLLTSAEIKCWYSSFSSCPFDLRYYFQGGLQDLHEQAAGAQRRLGHGKRAARSNYRVMGCRQRGCRQTKVTTRTWPSQRNLNPSPVSRRIYSAVRYIHSRRRWKTSEWHHNFELLLLSFAVDVSNSALSMIHSILLLLCYSTLHVN